MTKGLLTRIRITDDTVFNLKTRKVKGLSA